MNRLQVLLRDLEPGGAARQLSTAAVSAFLARTRPLTPADVQRKAIARELLDDLRRADRQLKAMAKTINGRSRQQRHEATLVDISVSLVVVGASSAAAVEPKWSRLHSRSMPLGDDALTTT
jgi:hypothetical protein